MSSFPGSPRLIKCGIVLIDQETAAIKRTITLQYNPDTITRSLQAKAMGGEGGNRSEALRLTGPPVETIKFEAEIDGTDQLETAASGSTIVQSGIQPQLAALETIIYPDSSQMQFNGLLAMAGTIEIIPMETALTLFMWSANRIVPVRLTEFSITEESFDINLNPIRAKINLGMRVLSIEDFGFSDRGASIYMTYQQNKERLAGLFTSNFFTPPGFNLIP